MGGGGGGGGGGGAGARAAKHIVTARNSHHAAPSRKPTGSRRARRRPRFRRYDTGFSLLGKTETKTGSVDFSAEDPVGHSQQVPDDDCGQPSWQRRGKVQRKRGFTPARRTATRRCARGRSQRGRGASARALRHHHRCLARDRSASSRCDHDGQHQAGEQRLEQAERSSRFSSCHFRGPLHPIGVPLFR